MGFVPVVGVNRQRAHVPGSPDGPTFACASATAARQTRDAIRLRSGPTPQGAALIARRPRLVEYAARVEAMTAERKPTTA